MSTAVENTDTNRSRRAAKTRHKLLEASASLLVERGYNRLSTAVVAERAGVAHGTLFKHFPTKSALMAATTKFVLEEVIDDFLTMAADSPVQGESIDHALGAAWSLFRSERLQASLELYVAARTDEALREAFQPIVTLHRSELLSAARAYFPAFADEPNFESTIMGIMATLLGGSLLWSITPEPDFFHSELSFVDRVVKAELARTSQETSE